MRIYVLIKGYLCFTTLHKMHNFLTYEGKTTIREITFYHHDKKHHVEEQLFNWSPYFIMFYDVHVRHTGSEKVKLVFFV